LLRSQAARRINAHGHSPTNLPHLKESLRRMSELVRLARVFDGQKQGKSQQKKESSRIALAPQKNVTH